MGNRKYLVLGPCAAESREQVIETASRICDLRFLQNLIFRAGAWKPRTRPDTFQGVGEEALPWLIEVKKTMGIPVATEVATPEHVEAAIKAGIDYLWIGARTAANPIAVSAIASQIYDLRFKIDDLKGILIKNPVNADAALWLGNIARLEQTGAPVIAVHRGCNHQPCWAMAHQVRLARPDIPMLIDPSHMSGDAKAVPALLDKIPELGLDGAMIEVHYKPDEALSDAKQQISPESLTSTLKDRFAEGPLRCKTANAEGLELNWLRAEIDELDERLWDTIAARMDVSRRIGIWKKAHNVAPLQPQRFHHIQEQVSAFAQAHGLDGEFAQKVLELVHTESLRQQ